MKLTGWYRIGIVLSILWCLIIIGITIYQYNYPNKLYLLVILETDATKFLSYDPLNINRGLVPDKLVVNYWNVFLSMIVPVIVGWVFVLTIIWTIKWVIMGFKRKEP